MESELLSGITERQRIFCREYVKHWNGRKAAKIAGYSEKTMLAFILKPEKVKEYIRLIQKDLEEVAGISRLKVLNEYMEIAFNSSKDGSRIKISDKVKALDSISRMLGYDSPVRMEVESRTEVDVRIRAQEEYLSDFSLEELETVKKLGLHSRIKKNASCN